MGILDAIKAIGLAIAEWGKFANKQAPTDKMKEAKFEREIPRKTVAEKRKMLSQAKAYLDLHLRQSVDAYVDVTFDDILNLEDVQEMREALYELFPKRKHKKQ